VIDPAVREPISIELHNVRARALLDAICESIGCRCKALGCEWSFTEAANGRKAVLRISLKKR
jgi:hypothetical protein